MPDLEEHIWQVFRERGVLVYGLHGGEPAELVADFIEQTGITFAVEFGNFTLQSFAFPIDGYPFPRQVLIGPDRVIRQLRSDLDVVDLAGAIESMLE